MKNRSSSRRPAAKITRTPDWGGEDHPFETGKAPAGRLLVIRDELEKTYDSRFFEVVSRDKVKGKALLIYWSPNTCTGWKRNQPRPPRPPGGGAARWGRLSGLVTRKQAGGTARVAPEARQRAKPLPATPPTLPNPSARRYAWCYVLCDRPGLATRESKSRKKLSTARQETK